MASTLVQFRTDDQEKNNAAAVCKTIGIDLQDYLRLCMARLISEQGIPFSMNASDICAAKAKKAMKLASRIAAENGVADLSLDEINAEIIAARKELSAK